MAVVRNLCFGVMPSRYYRPTGAMLMKFEGLVQEIVMWTKHNFTKERKSLNNTLFNFLKWSFRVKSSTCIGLMDPILALNKARNLFQYGNTYNPFFNNRCLTGSCIKPFKFVYSLNMNISTNSIWNMFVC